MKRAKKGRENIKVRTQEEDKSGIFLEKIEENFDQQWQAIVLTHTVPLLLTCLFLLVCRSSNDR